MTKEKDSQNNMEHSQHQGEVVDMDYCHTPLTNNLFWQELKTIAEDGVKE